MTLNRLNPIAGAVLAFAGMTGSAAADAHCPDFGFETAWLNAFFCARLEALSEGETPPPTRNLGIPDDEAAEFIDALPLVREAFHADPRRTLELIDRIRSAGGTTKR